MSGRRARSGHIECLEATLRTIVLSLLLVGSTSLFGATLAPSAFVCDACAYGVVIADFNGDGLDDLLSLKAREMRFNLDGHFGPPVSLSGLGVNDDVQIAGDFNGDGLADVVARNIAGPHNEGPDRLLWGNGSGGFTAGAAYPKEHGSTAGDPIDYDGDGNLDLVLISLAGRKPVTLEAISKLTFMRGNGDGTFVLDQSVQFPYGMFPDIGAADFNSDGRRDLVLSFRDPHLYFYYADGNGQWGEPQVRFTGVHVSDMRVADVNGDTRADIVFTDWYDQRSALTVLFGDGAGQFPATARRAGIEPNDGIVVGDLFAGGAAEIAYVSQKEGVVALTATGNELQVVDRAAPGLADPSIRAFRGRKNHPLDLMSLGKLGYPRIAARPVFADGAVADAPIAAGRRGRAMGRGTGATQQAVAPSRYVGRTMGVCAPAAALDQWSFSREGDGVFLDGLTVGGATEAEAAIVDGQMIMRLTLPDGAHGERRIWGAVTYSPQRLWGYVRDINGATSCGEAGRLRINAQRSTM